MRTQHLFLIIIFILLVSFPAIASDWELLSYTKEFVTYVDKQSIKEDDSKREFWLEHRFGNNTLEPTSGKYYIKSTEYWEIDCKNNTLKIHVLNYYSTDGRLVNSISQSNPSIMKIVPDSVSDIVKKYVCGIQQTNPTITSDWVAVATNDKTTAYIDKQSIKGEGTKTKFWLRYMMKNEDIDPETGKSYIEMRQYWEIDCNNRSSVNVYQVVFYSINGTIISKYYSTPPTVIKFVPHSVVDLAQRYICDFKPTK